MLLKYFYDDELAQASYLVGCAATGEALVVDPMRDIAPYLRVAEKEGLKITQVTETHIHADFVSGSRELAAHTGAKIYLSDMGDADWKYGYTDDPTVILVRDNDTWMLGNIRIEVVHTPGHTPEHISFLVTDTAGADKPIGMFTGDFLFVGDVGRPDLLEAAAGYVGTKEPGARRQFHSVQRIKELPDYLQVWPAHGAGSACGKALGAIPSTTLGYEKLFNPAFQIGQEDDFVQWLLEGQPEAPRYFARMKYVNKVGPALLSELPDPQHLDRAALDKALRADELVVDLRSPEAFSHAYVPGTVNIPASGMFTTFVGWFVDYEAPFYFIAPQDMDVSELYRSLHAVGVDNIPGYFTSEVMQAGSSAMPTVSVDELVERLAQNNLMLLDVRGQTEYDAVHIPGATHIPLGYIPRHLDDIPRDRPVETQCVTGPRAQIAASLLRRYGFENVSPLMDPEQRWMQELTHESVA